MSEALKQHYQRLWGQFGDSPQAVQHCDRPSQYRRFELLTEGMPGRAVSVIDLGCGLGHLTEFLLDRKPEVSYLGLDLVPEFIEQARARFANRPNVAFQLFDMARDPLPRGYDFVMVCGVFNNRREDNQAFMRRVLAEMFRAATHGIAFNALSTYVEYQDPELSYSDPLEVFDFCKRHLSRRVALRHDYSVKPGRFPYEYTMYVYKDAGP